MRTRTAGSSMVHLHRRRRRTQRRYRDHATRPADVLSAIPRVLLPGQSSSSKSGQAAMSTPWLSGEASDPDLGEEGVMPGMVTVCREHCPQRATCRW
ncbi:MAG TPA: hypothetical protein VMM81_01010 [Acidimicrobiia bacterium]|nr:hypothetical protein [Acidimicrobiia bacterium]